MKTTRVSGNRLPGFPGEQLSDQTAGVATPCMILRRSIIQDRFQRLSAALPGVEVFYAVKANPHPALLETLHLCGSRFDISSAAELRGVMEAGEHPGHTIHTNPIKSPGEFDTAVALGCRTFVADNADELDKFVTYGEAVSVMLRFKTAEAGSVVNLSYKFGADPSDIPALLDKIKALEIPFAGFCFHVGSQCTEASAYTAAIKTAASLIQTARARGLDTMVLDIGGGFPISYTHAVPSIERIGARITAALRRHIAPNIRVICEPGRYISGEAVTLVTSVIGKAVRDGMPWYYLDDGVYGSFSGRIYDHCVYPIVTDRKTPLNEAVLAGPTCDSFDVIYKSCRLPSLNIGDRLYFPATGAYCSVSATRFNGLAMAQIIPVDW